MVDIMSRAPAFPSIPSSPHSIAFYLGHRDEVDANILEGEKDLERRVPHLSQSRPELYARLAARA
jgi:hypothetical protein